MEATLEPNDLEDVWNDIRHVGDALGVAQGADELIASLTRRLANIGEKSDGAESRPGAQHHGYQAPLRRWTAHS